MYCPRIRIKHVGLALVSVLYLSSVANQLGDWDGDAAHYVLLGESLARGRGYTEPVYPRHYTHTKYPFLYPALLAPVIRLAGLSMLAVRIETAILAILSIAAWHGFFSRRLEPFQALALTALFASNPYSFSFVTRTLSETPYLLFSGVCFFALARWRDEGKQRHLALLTSAAILCYFTRTAGLSLFVGLLAATLLSRSLRSRKAFGVPAWLFMAIALSLAFGAWTAFVIVHRNPIYDYFHELASGQEGLIDLAGLESRVALNAGYYFLQAPAELFSVNGTDGMGFKFAAAMAWAVLALGAFRAGQKGELAEVLSAGASAAMVLLWPAYLDFRFFYPLLPLFFLFGYRGLEAVAAAWPRGGKALAALLWAALILAYGIRTGQIVKAQHTPNPFPPSPRTMLGYYIEKPVIDWSETYYAYHTPKNIFVLGEFIFMHRLVAETIPPGPVLASEEPRDTAFLLGRPAVTLPSNSDPAAALDYLASWDVKYIILDRYSSNTGQFTLPLIRSHPQYFTQVIGDPGWLAPAVYRVDLPN